MVEIPIHVKKYRDDYSRNKTGESSEKDRASDSEQNLSGGEIFLDYLVKIPLFLVVFLVPLFFWPSSDVLGLPKQFLLSLLALVSLAAWIGRVIVSGKITLRLHTVIAPLLLVVLAGIFSIYFSSSKWVSFLGDTSRYTLSGLSLFSYLIIFFVAFQNLDRNEVKGVVGLLFFSVFLLMALAVLHFLNIFVFPFDFTKSRVFNPIGSLSSLAAFAAALLPFIMVWLEEHFSLKSWRFKFLSLIFAAFALLQSGMAVLIDAVPVWMGLIVSSAVLVILEVLNPK